MRRRLPVLLAFAVLLAGGCSSGDESTGEPPPDFSAPSPAAPDAGACAVSAKLVPACGALLGVSVAPDSGTKVTTMEKAAGRRMDIVYEFHGIDKPLPARDEAEMVAGGRILHVNIEAKEFKQPGKPEVKWSRITGGEFDAALKEQATGLAALKAPVMVTFDHEVDSPKRVGKRGSAAEFVAAWRHIHDVYRQAGATNIVWVWVVTGYEGNWSSVPSIYPGNSYVDWVSWDPYNFAGCQTGPVRADKWQSFEQTVRPFYDWLGTEGAAAGIAADKPLMLSETGSVANPDDPSARAQWIADIPAAMVKFPKLKAVTFWNGKIEGCDFRIDSDTTAVKSFGMVSKAATFAKPSAGLAKVVPVAK